tara:strand:+ start:87 stop:776 length:690 start_codon:yes stop_codon:yes gene_type:complete
MIKPIDFHNLQSFAFTEGIASVAPGSLDAINNVNGDLSDSTLDAIQQNYPGRDTTFLDYQIWVDSLNGARQRPYFDMHLYPFTTAVRLPVVNHEYDVYADKGTFYEDVHIKGGATIDGGVTGELKISGTLAFSRDIEVVTADKTIASGDKSKIFHVEPAGTSVTITLPVVDMEAGFFIEVVNGIEGKFTLIQPEQGVLKAKGTGLSQPYSAATVYWTGTQWYAIGDLTE